MSKVTQILDFTSNSRLTFKATGRYKSAKMWRFITIYGAFLGGRP